MSRLYTVLNAVLLVGGVVALVFGAWPLGIVLLLLGGTGLALEIRARRTSVHVVLDGGPDATMEKELARAYSEVNSRNQTPAGGTQFTGGGF